MTRVKICGLTSAAEAKAAAAAGAFAIGFNFYAPSPRYIEPDKAHQIASELPERIWRVGVFVNPTREAVNAVVAAGFLSALQLHGSESQELCRGWSLPVIKAVRIRSRDDVVRAARLLVDFVLADAYVEGVPGGTGARFDWDLLEGFDRSRLILAGGLHPGNVASAVRSVQPYAVDVASGVESAPGVKDPEKVRQFITHAQNA